MSHVVLWIPSTRENGSSKSVISLQEGRQKSNVIRCLTLIFSRIKLGRLSLSSVLVTLAIKNMSRNIVSSRRPDLSRSSPKNEASYVFFVGFICG